MGEELGFVGGYVDADWTFGFASLAGQAEVERVLDFFAAPAVLDDFTLRHLPKQVSTAAGGVFLFAGGAVAGAHHPAFIVAALAYTYAAQSCLGEAAVVGGELEIGFRFPGSVRGAEAEIFVELVGLDQLAGIHFPI